MSIKEAAKLTGEGLTSAVADNQLFDAVTHWLQEALVGKCHIEKVGFVRSVIETINDPRLSADSELSAERISQKVDRMRSGFLRDNSSGARLEQAYVMFEDLLAALGEDIESDAIRTEVSRLRRDFDIDKQMTEPIHNYENFRVQLEGVQYAGRVATQEEKIALEGATSTAS